MFLEDFDSLAIRFEKIQTYLRENHNCEIDIGSMTMAKANRLIKQTAAHTKRLSESDQEHAKLVLIAEGLKLWKLAPVQTELSMPAVKVYEQRDNSIEEAKVILAAQEMQDQLQKIVEDLAEMQVQSLMPIVDAMKEEIGTREAEEFNSTVDDALGQLLDVAKEAKDSLTNAILVASGEAPLEDIGSSVSDFEAPDLGDEEDQSQEDGFEEPAEFERSDRELKMENLDFASALKEMRDLAQDGKISISALEKLIQAK